MTYFGIRNHNSDANAALINWSSYSNILKPEIEFLWPKLLNGEKVVLPLELEYDESIDLVLPESPKPLLFEHFEHLTTLWKDFKDKSFISNRRTMKLLTETRKEIEFELMVKFMTIENEKRIMYILNDKPQPYVEDVKPVNATYTLIKRTSDIGYTEYYCKSKTYNGFDFHYTSKIDAYHSSSGNPIKLKSLQNRGRCDLRPYIAYKIAIECYLADVDKVLCGFYDEETVNLKLFSWDWLNKQAAKKNLSIHSDIQFMEKNIKEITDFVNGKDVTLIGKTVNISKQPGNNFVFNIN